MPAPIVAVEMGTSKIVVLVGEISEDRGITIIGMGESSPTGLRKGEVVSLDTASGALRIALQKAEKSAEATLRSVYLSIAGGHIRNSFSEGNSIVADPDVGITVDDINAVVEVAKAVNLPQQQTTIHSFSQHFTIDNQQHVINPEGMDGERLALRMMILHGNEGCIANTYNVVQSINIDIDDVVFGGLCSAQAVLSNEQKDSGVVVIDIGGGTTDYIAYKDSSIITAGSLAVGGDHITNDMVLAFNIPRGRAEEVKQKFGQAIISNYDPEKRIVLKPEVGFVGKTFSHHAMNTVIHARVDEMLRTVLKRLDEDAVLDNVGAGVVLTGGCARLDGIKILAREVFGVPCTVVKPNITGSLTSKIDGPEYSTCYGLIKYAAQRELRQESGGIWKNIVRRIFG
ncbi:MAG: cell division protein FtsA [Kiritimatiellae bacterium]|nr:cell division protein FtsA [Kiritimatiellia bacterium]